MLIDKEKIWKAKEKLGVEGADIIAATVGLRQYDSHNHKGLCCFHDEDTPSMIWNPKSNSFHCFGCNRNLDIIDAYMLMGDTYLGAVRKLFEKASIPYSFGEVGVKTKQAYYYPQPIYANNCDQAYSYLNRRGISTEVCEYLNLKQDERGNILIQYFDTNDVLTMVKVRPSHKVKHGETKIWCLKDKHGNAYGTAPLLYNMNKINVNAPLLICSGEFDCAAAIESGFANAVSIPLGDGNTRWIDECFDWLEQFNEIIICPDNDESGTKFAKTVVPRLGSWRCKVAKVPDLFITPSGKEIPVKDLNEVLIRWGKEKVLDIIINAQDSPIPSLIDFSDIEDIDLSDIDGIYTGIKGIDKEIMRLFFGTLTLISGTPGSGKTSFMYQIACSCLDQGYDPWVFSRELPAYMSRNWINYLFAGRRHISKYHGDNDTVYYKVDSDAKAAIGNYYKGRMYFYRDDYDNDVQSLKDSMVDAARKYGSRLFILDNLTTINLGGDEESKYTKQTELVNWLIQFSLKYNVATVLICHPRKMQEYTDSVGMYDIGGSSNLINLAHRALSLKRVTKKEKEGTPKRNGKGWEKPPIKYDVIVSVIKDRMRGKSGFEWGLYYDIPSRRFFSTPEEFDRQYAWDKTRYTDTLEYPIKAEEDEVLGAPIMEGGG